MRKLCIGILANVDAGKTTLSESILYKRGVIRRLGRVDHQDSFFDTDKTERERGITIFSKQAVFSTDKFDITLLDTPGHVDFSTEMERALSVMDMAILVISASDGVTSHTETLRMLLTQYRIPTLLFINKMDLVQETQEEVFENIRHDYSKKCVNFNLPRSHPLFCDQISMCNEELMECVLEEKDIPDEMIRKAFAENEIIPCFSGSALKMDGVDPLLDAVDRFAPEKEYGDAFGAIVFKITHDDQGNRLTHLKITGGELQVKTLIVSKEEEWSEKVEQIRIYSGTRYTTVPLCKAGTVCAVTGLSNTFAGQGLGTEFGMHAPLIEPVLTYKMILEDKVNVHEAFLKLKPFEEEDPSLHLVWNEQSKEIHIQLMGAIQLEILSGKIKERLGLNVTFAQGSIIYKETIAKPVEGVGHFEPLRHYAEVHLLLEPGEPGSGLVFESRCSEDILAASWQRLILTHLEERIHKGVLTRSPVTDMKISLLTGKAHPKHTEGGDFRQATYRAVRHGLMSTKSILLEPYYRFTMQLPSENIGRAMMDVEGAFGSVNPPENNGTTATITGLVPVSTFSDYSQTLAAYTKGRGHITFRSGGYLPCHNAEEVILEKGYNPEEDLHNTADSVFCEHGSGVVVNWRDVTSRMHLESAWNPEGNTDSGNIPAAVRPAVRREYASSIEEDKALMAIFEKTYGPIRQRVVNDKKPRVAGIDTDKKVRKPAPAKPEMLLVDGYNIIHDWDELKQYADNDFDLARKLLTDQLVNYQGYRKNDIILVFDAYKVKGRLRTVEKEGGITVIYTKEAETADAYIEKASYDLASKYQVKVATSDYQVQLIVFGNGAIRMSARELHDAVRSVHQEISTIIAKPHGSA